MPSKMLAYTKALNRFYVENKPFWQVDFDWSGFQWIDCNDNENSIIALIRRAEDHSDFIICVHNFTPEVHHGYRIGVPTKGTYVEVFNSDEEMYGGSGVCNTGDIVSEDYGFHGREQSIVITVPPLASTFYRLGRQSSAGTPVSELPEVADAVSKESAAALNPGAVAAATKTKKAARKKRSAAADEAVQKKPAAKKRTAKAEAKELPAAEDAPAKPKRTSKRTTAAADKEAPPLATKVTAAKKKTVRKKAATQDTEEKPPKAARATKRAL